MRHFHGRPLAAIGLAALLMLAGCGGTAPATPGASPTSPPTGGATPTASTTSEVPLTGAVVYFPRDSTRGVRLARERRDVRADDVVAGAVEAMLAGPRDPDYLGGWAPGTRLLGVSTSGDVTTVDLSAEARTTTLGSEASAAAVDQLVWTVTEITGAGSRVLLTIEGEPAGELWGVPAWDEPQARRDAFTVRVPVAIDAPLEGAEVTSPVTVAGNAAVYEANLPWRVFDESGELAEEGYTMTAEGQTFADYSFTVDLEPGTYVGEIREDDPSAGEGGPVDVDTRTVVVTG